jgi:hypothetical protein
MIKLSVKEYAEKYNMSLNNVYQKIKRNTLNHTKENGKTVIIIEESNIKKTINKDCKKYKQKIKELKKDIEVLSYKLQSKENENSSLKIMLDIFSSSFNKQLNHIENDIIEVETKKKTKEKKSKKKKK